MRVGIGFDAHPFENGRKLILGGVHIPHEKGLYGHSDADVLVHAVIDAILGAAGMGDIGLMFPDSDEQYKGISSLALLDRAHNYVLQNGWRVSNIDTVIVADAPRMSPYYETMRANIAAILGISSCECNVKASTTEGMGFTGRQEGIAAHAVALLVSEKQKPEER